MNANLALAYRIKNTMKAVNTIIDSLVEKLEEKSADKDEVLSLKKELTSKVIETLAPINEEIRKRKERDNNNTEDIVFEEIRKRKERDKHMGNTEVIFET
jgi:tryptophanyl-tRNA synthetase